jgi:hypothetical protein
VIPPSSKPLPAFLMAQQELIRSPPPFFRKPLPVVAAEAFAVPSTFRNGFIPDLPLVSLSQATVSFMTDFFVIV